MLLVIKKKTSYLHSFSCWYLLYSRRSGCTCKLAVNKMLYNQNLIGIYWPICVKIERGNSTSFLNSRKAKSVLSAFYFWRVASKFQEMGGVLGFFPRKYFFFPQNSDSVGRKLFSFPWNLNFFPCNFFFVRWNFCFLGHFFDYKPWFLHESAQFSSERREISKKNKPISCENIKKLRNSKALRIYYFRPTLLELQMAC